MTGNLNVMLTNEKHDDQHFLAPSGFKEYFISSLTCDYLYSYLVIVLGSKKKNVGNHCFIQEILFQLNQYNQSSQYFVLCSPPIGYYVVHLLDTM